MTSSSSSNLWVFGYGSLIWNPGFKYKKATIGHVRGYVRRFWQGNTVQRGTADQPGRVATLIEEGEGRTWGVAFELSEEDTATTFNYLHKRETHLGGYRTSIVHFQPKDASQSAFPVLVYVATPESDAYLGPAPVVDLASEIVAARGVCGHNVEYVVRLADFMRHALPEITDDHLYALEDHVRIEIKERNLCFRTLMGPDYREPSYKNVLLNRADGPVAHLDDNNNNNDGAAVVGGGGGRADPDDDRPPREDPSTFLYASRVPPKKLRCLNV